MKWFRKAADQGFAAAQYCLGNKYFSGQGVPQNYAEAARWLRNAADLGGAEAQFMAGVMSAGVCATRRMTGSPLVRLELSMNWEKFFDGMMETPLVIFNSPPPRNRREECFQIVWNSRGVAIVRRLHAGRSAQSGRRDRIVAARQACADRLTGERVFAPIASINTDTRQRYRDLVGAEARRA